MQNIVKNPGNSDSLRAESEAMTQADLLSSWPPFLDLKNSASAETIQNSFGFCFDMMQLSSQ